jgi:hypothetical protein
LLNAQLVNIKSPICKNEAQQNGGSILKPNPILNEKRQKETVSNIIATNNIELITIRIVFLVWVFISP